MLSGKCLAVFLLSLVAISVWGADAKGPRSRADAGRGVSPANGSSNSTASPAPARSTALVESLDDEARAGLQLLGAELLAGETFSADRSIGKFSGLKVGKIYPTGPAAEAGLFSGDIIVEVFEPDPAVGGGMTDKYAKTVADFGRFLNRFGLEAKVLLTVRPANDPYSGEPGYTGTTMVIVTLDRQYGNQAFVEQPRPGQKYGMTPDVALRKYRAWFETFKTTDAGIALLSAHLPPQTPRGSLEGKTYLQGMDNRGPRGIQLFYDERLARTPGVVEVDAYLVSQDGREPPLTTMLAPDWVAMIRSVMGRQAPTATMINLYLAAGPRVYARFQLIPEGGRSGAPTLPIGQMMDYAWAVWDPSRPETAQPSDVSSGFDPTKYYLGHTLQNIIEGRGDLVRANRLIMQNLQFLLAHYAVAYGQTQCVEDPVEFTFAREITTTNGLGVYLGSHTYHDTIKIAARHRDLVQAAFDGRLSALNPMNRAMYKDIQEFFANYPCSSPIHEALERNLRELLSGDAP